MVAYLNQIMGLSDPATATILDPKICIDVKEEVQGMVQLVQKCFLDYSAYGLYPLNELRGAACSGVHPRSTRLTRGRLVRVSDCGGSGGTFVQIVYGPILDAVFPDDAGCRI